MVTEGDARHHHLSNHNPNFYIPEEELSEYNFDFDVNNNNNNNNKDLIRSSIVYPLDAKEMKVLCISRIPKGILFIYLLILYIYLLL